MKKKIAKHNQLPSDALLLDTLTHHQKPLRIEGLLAIANIPANARKKAEAALRHLADQGKIARLPGGFWGLAEKSICVTGEFAAQTNGSGRVRITEPSDYPLKEIFISPFQTGGAWHKDTVRALVLPHTQGSKGKILEVVDRSLKEIPALYEGRKKKSLRFKAADGRISTQFIVPGNCSHVDSIKEGDLAILKPLKETKDGVWQAEIIKVLGDAEKIAAQESIVKVSQQVPGPFPKLALEQAAALPPAPLESDLNGREDWRTLPFVTIDGADARDFDDAIHVEKTADGWILRVAIADVSHYVRPDENPDSLDQEALRRGNSWYFPRSVEPMLPKALSNGLCSLKPDEDRLAMMVEMPFDKNGNPLTPRFAAIVMRSQARLIYDNVARLFAGEEIELPRPELKAMLQEAHTLYKKIAQRRRDRGTLDFFLPEPAYKFDVSGALIDMGETQRNDAHMLIEEFMIAANEAVASHLGKQKKELLYRVHPQPEQEKLAKLYETLELTALESLPEDFRKDGEPNPKAIQEILSKAAGTPKEFVVNRLCLRSMAQARYQPENIGHFGLASESYCHFTSPIRRYADLLTHRALKASMGHKDQQAPDREQLTEIGYQLNGLERRAVECEREMAKRLACLYLQDKEGEIFDGTISGVTDFGLFVELADIPAEGLMRTEDLGNDWYRVDQPTQTLIGVHSGHVWRLGEPIKVKLERVDLEKQELRLLPTQKPALKLPKATRQTFKLKGKEHRSEHNKPARSSRWSRRERTERKSRKK